MITTGNATTRSEGRIPWKGRETWYQVQGDVHEGTPLVILHGGPGATHDYLSSIGEIATTGRACVFYDQVGNGRSSRHPDAPDDTWTVELFLEELERLLAHLGIADTYHLLGQSWGGMLAMEHALLRPTGLRSIVVANAPASAKLWAAEATRLVSELPADVRAVLDHAHATGDTDTAAYEQATEVYFRRHVCRLVPPPPEVQATFTALHADPTVYASMVGPSEMNPTGTLKDWDITHRLKDITTPTLIVSGRFDEATPTVVQPIADRIPHSTWVIFEQSSHMPHVEEHDRYIEVVTEFLTRHDP